MAPPPVMPGAKRCAPLTTIVSGRRRPRLPARPLRQWRQPSLSPVVLAFGGSRADTPHMTKRATAGEQGAATALLACLSLLLALFPAPCSARTSARPGASARPACCCSATCTKPCSKEAAQGGVPCPESCVIPAPLATDAPTAASVVPPDGARTTVSFADYSTVVAPPSRTATRSLSPPESPPLGLTLSQLSVRRI